MKRHKIALVCDWYLPRIGGLELHLRDLAQQLMARGHDVHVICATPGPVIRDGVTVHRLPVPLMPVLRTIRDPSGIAALTDVLRRERFDVIHAHNAYSPLALCALLVARRLGVPSVFTEHSVLRGASSVVLRGLQCVYPWTSWPTVLSAVSEFSAEDLRVISGRDDVFVVLNAVDPSAWTADRSGAWAGEPRVTGVMRFTRRKRPVDIVRVIPRVHEMLPQGLRPRFTLIGDGPERAHVEREARRLGVTEHLELLGRRSRGEIRGVLGRTSVFVIPSLKEALSIVAIEARAAGVPVVARTPSGVAEVIEHGVHGFLAKNLDEFAGHIARLVHDDVLRQRLGENARRGLERFTWDRAIDRHLDLYHLAIQRCRETREMDMRPIEDEQVTPLRAHGPRARL